METTGLLGATRIRSAARWPPSPPERGGRTRGPTKVMSRAAGSACNRTQYSWKCTARRPPGACSSAMVTWVSTRSSVIGSSRSCGSWASQRVVSAAVTSDSG